MRLAIGSGGRPVDSRFVITDQIFKLIATVCYFLVMIAIGLWANRRTRNLADYMLGGRNLNPMVAALSAGASDMSGWLLLGLPGALYAIELASKIGRASCRERV